MSTARCLATARSAECPGGSRTAAGVLQQSLHEHGQPCTETRTAGMARTDGDTGDVGLKPHREEQCSRMSPAYLCETVAEKSNHIEN